MRTLPRAMARAIATSVVAATMLAMPGIAQPTDPQRDRGIINEGSRSAIPGQYIVVFKPGPRSLEASAAAQKRLEASGAKVLNVYRAALIGFSVALPGEPDRAKVAIETLRSLPEVAFIEANAKGEYYTMQPPNPAGTPPTGLDRIDRRLLPTNGVYTYSETGAGVHAYVIDSGIRITHAEFGGRATDDFTVVPGNFSDCADHGTHVAGTVGGATFGVAKAVFIHNVRVGDAAGCTPTVANQIAGVDWVTMNRILPAVANMSIGTTPASPAVNTAVANSIAAGVTYAVAAGNANVDACNTSPANQALAITVGAVDPANDTRAVFSNFGPCVDLFAPGVGILSSVRTSDSATGMKNGTSMASPHVAGVAARWLQTHPAATPAMVWTAILNAADTAATAGWGGVVNPGVGSPNVLLHYGSLNDGVTDGDPHIRTVDGVRYDFQSAGEFVVLRDANGTEIQTRQTPVSTQPPIADPHTGLAACVSLNTALAARVGGRRVTYQPGPNGMQLRIDGAPVSVTQQGITIAPGGRVAATPIGNGIDIDFPDGTNLTATSNFWGAPHNKWYLNVSVFGTPAYEGVMGAIAPGSWLPALPGGGSIGPKPASAAQRYNDLYGTFADAWRVGDKSSLFDYAPGESTKSYTNKKWPPNGGDCTIPNAPIAVAMDQRAAAQLCRGIRSKERNANCVFDVAVTGDAGFAKAYFVSERLELYSTRTMVSAGIDARIPGAPAVLTASVSRRVLWDAKNAPRGHVEFVVNGKRAGAAKLDARGEAKLLLPNFGRGKYRLAAYYVPSRSGGDLASSSSEVIYVSENDSRPLQ